MSITSDFQFNGYEIPKLFVEIPPDYAADSSDSINYYAKYFLTYSDNNWVGEVVLGFRQTSVHNPSHYLFEVVIIGRFNCFGENDEDTKLRFVKFLKGSGAATLIPIARSVVVSTSALTGHPGTAVIPNINVFQMNWIEPSDNPPSQLKEHSELSDK